MTTTNFNNLFNEKKKAFGTEKTSSQKTRSFNNPDILNISHRRHLRVYKLWSDMKIKSIIKKYCKKQTTFDIKNLLIKL